MEVAKTDPIHIDLDSQTVTTPFRIGSNSRSIPSETMPARWLDEIGLTLAMDARISSYEQRASTAWPWQGGASA